MKKTAVFALTPQGARLGKQLASQMDGDLYLPARLADDYGAIPFDRFREVVVDQFLSYSRQIFIAAAGIVVRSIAPHLRTKDKDPAVVVLDQEGRFAISLLSGHLGGANDLAREVAGWTGGEAVITTATDSAGVPSFDLLAKERNIAIGNLEAVKSVNMALLRGETVQIFDPENRLGLKDLGTVGFSTEWLEKEEQWVNGTPGIWVTWRSKEPESNQLVLHPRCLVVGIGCNRGTGREEITNLLASTLRENTLSLKSLHCLTTIEAKKDERGLLDAARQLDVPLVFFGGSELSSIEVPNPSGIVKEHMGVSSVCEATALLKSKGGRLLVPKTKSRNVTLAIALEN
jgi:cobalt-precorrin 5A hydrolase